MTAVYIVTGHWSYGAEDGWTLEHVFASRADAEAYVAALPREAYARGDASWHYQVEEHEVRADLAAAMEHAR